MSWSNLSVELGGKKDQKNKCIFLEQTNNTKSEGASNFIYTIYKHCRRITYKELENSFRPLI